MGQVSTSVELPAEPSAVWDYISIPANYEKWMTIHKKWKCDVPDAFAKGSQAAEVISMLGMDNVITWTVDEYEPPSRLAISGTGLAGVKSRFVITVEAGGAGSLASIEAEFEGQMVKGALAKAVEKDAKKNLETSLAKLTELLDKA